MTDHAMLEPPRHWAGLALDRPLVMGILNATPDSFSDGGRYPDAAAAIEAGLAMVAAGADIVDVGGESTRPGAAPVTESEEIDRVVPVIAGLASRGVVVSVDTRNAATMAESLDAGARIVNDVSGLAHDPHAAHVVAARRACVVLMHMRGDPPTMTTLADYDDVVAEVAGELAGRRDAAVTAGISPEAIALDPGIGFAKEGAQNVALLRGLGAITALGHPVLIGLSRKRFIGTITGESVPARRDPGSVAASLVAAINGAAILRVHDVRGMAQALAVWRALASS